ncbi:MAG: hypothetical protein MI919_20745 [Holophagales bacterium]|nr:hypothetical protein [Holophagales bacterium]
MDPDSGKPLARRLRLHVLEAGEEIYRIELEAVPEDGQELEIRVPMAETPVPSPPLAEITELLDTTPPADLLEHLACHGIHTLADIRSAGRLGGLKGVDGDHAAVRALEAHSRLDTLSGSDAEGNAALIAAGFGSVSALASATRAEVVAATHGDLGDFAAASSQTQSRARTALVENVLAAHRAHRSNGYQADGPVPDEIEGGLSALFEDACGCGDCGAAVSPLAYLADLLDYALTHLRIDGGAVELDDLEQRFHQPFGDLPATCDETELRQARLSIEVLRRYLGTAALPAPGSAEETALADAQQDYLLATYTALLAEMGTSFDEVRRARSASDEDRRALADRLGIGLDGNRPDRLDALLVAPAVLGEARIERYFGLADTRRDPLSDGPVAGDAHGQVRRWQLDGVAWNRNSDAEGKLYASLEKAGGMVRADLYRDFDLTEKVASGQRASSPPDGPIELVAVGGSGLRGRLEIAFLVDTERIELSTLPAVLGWRLEHLRDTWYAEDFPSSPPADSRPLIDPDLVGPGDLRTPSAGDSAYDLWQARRDLVDARVTFLDSERSAAASDIEGLEAMLEATESGLATELGNLEDRRTQGEDIGPRLDELFLAVDAFDELLRLRRLAIDGVPILDSEWRDGVSILVQVEKGRLIASWREEESTAGLALSPDHFRIPEPAPVAFPPVAESPLPVWRATEAERRNWQRLLEARLEQEKAMIEAWQEGVDTVEAQTLPLLRDALILASDAPGIELAEKADALLGSLLIETRNTGCQKTTRIAQAIETLQILVWSVRTHQLAGSHPDLGIDDDDFEDSWRWLGSFATWRAAILVFLYPENVLWPGLRRWQTPAFRKLVRELRANTGLTPEAACRAAEAYADTYFDISHLRLGASCQSRTRIHTGDNCRERAATDYRYLFYTFATGGRSRLVYWSAYDPQDASGYAQSFWDVVPGLGEVTEILAAVPYQISSGERFFLLFVLGSERGEQKLLFSRYDLEQQAWDREPIALDLPAAEGAYDIVVEQRNDESAVPHLALADGEGRIYSRRLRRDASDWEDQDFLVISDPEIEEQAGLGRPPLATLDALVAQDGQAGQAGYLYVRRRNGVLDVGLFTRDLDITPFPMWFQRGTGTWLGALPVESTHYGFYRTGSSVRYFEAGDLIGGAFFTNLGGLQELAVHCGRDPLSGSVYLAQRKTSGLVGVYRSTLDRGANDQLNELERDRIAPLVVGPFDIPERPPEAKLPLRRFLIRTSFEANPDGPRSNLAYLEEAYFFVPVQLALQLQQRGHYENALSYLRTVYDYAALDPAERKIYHGLVLEESLPTVYERADDWLLDPLNPHAIASTRALTYTRFTLLSLIRCFLDFADAEFTRDTAESVPRARTLYRSALELLETPELEQHLGGCEELIGELDIEIGAMIEADDARWLPVWRDLRASLRRIGDRPRLRMALEEGRAAMLGEGPMPERLDATRKVIDRRLAEAPSSPDLRAVIVEKHETLARAEALIFQTGEGASALRGVATAAERDFAHTVSAITGLTSESLGREPHELPWLRNRMSAIEPTGKKVGGAVPLVAESIDPNASRDDHRELVEARAAVPGRATAVARLAGRAPNRAAKLVRRFGDLYTPTLAFRFCVPPNPVLAGLHLRADSELFKLRSCRNIAGLERELEPYVAPVGIEGVAMPTLGSGGRLTLPGAVALRPTAFRYAVLIERAKQLVGLAGQIEAAFLSTLEKRDAEYYNLLQARQEIELSRSGVRLHQLRVRGARDGVRLAELQRDRSRVQADHFRDLLDEGRSELETKALEVLVLSLGVADSISISASITGPSVSASYSPSGKLQTLSNIFSTLASFERRRQEWELQSQLAQQDLRIGNQQIKIADDQLRIVGQEHAIARIQADNAEETVDFLANKFTNVELYDWMSNVLEGVYSSFLQQATAMAQLAAQQLAFERQEVPPPFIQADYWQAPLGEGGSAEGEGTSPDRRGLTGSARLLRDIFQLDQHAFDTDERKLHLSKTVSLARLAPVEFQRFRENGELPFALPMELFDRDFPGHYLRLIRRVTVSVIALVPPTEGIRATLATPGISRVVVEREGIFQSTEIRRPPESVALSAANSASGVFELSVRSQGKLMPFEGMGVETFWQLSMPRASNAFDYRTMVDVLIGIEYTALDSTDYQQQVLAQLPGEISADRPFSFRQDLADPFYDLHNPDQTAEPMVVRFETTEADFPPNLEDPRIEKVVLFFARSDGASFELAVEDLSFTEAATGTTSGGGATSIDGVISTERGNAGAWLPMVGKRPIGEWRLALPDSPEVREHFETNAIEDILLVVGYRAKFVS